MKMMKVMKSEREQLVWTSVILAVFLVACAFITSANCQTTDTSQSPSVQTAQKQLDRGVWVATTATLLSGQQVNGGNFTVFDNVASQSQTWEVKITGTAPATTSITISPCMRGGTCSTNITSTSTASVILTSTGLFDNFLITVSWTGGDATTVIRINRTASVAKAGGGGGVVASVFTRTGAVTAQSGDYTCAQVTNCWATLPTGTDSGVVNAYVVANLSPAMPGSAGVPTNGATGCFVPTNANTNGTPTVAFSGLNTITIAKQWGSLAATNELITTKLACMVYDSTAANFKLINPAAVTGTGTGVMATSPTFVTKISVPLVQVSGTTFTTNAGCGEGALVGGVSAGKITTAGSTSCTDIITIATAAINGWQCTFTDLTTAADAASPHQTATTTTTVTWVSGTIVAADVIQFACIAY